MAREVIFDGAIGFNTIEMEISYTYERDGSDMVYTPRFLATKGAGYQWGWLQYASLTVQIGGETVSGIWDDIYTTLAEAELPPLRVQTRDVSGIPGCSAGVHFGAEGMDKPFTAVVTAAPGPEIYARIGGGAVPVTVYANIGGQAVPIARAVTR